jgi:hypothetical protein
LIDNGNFLGEAERMIERHDVAHRPDAQALGARAGADRIKARRRHPALVGPEMMLDAERLVEAEFVAQCELAPKLLIARVRRHPGLGPDVGEVGEFHGSKRALGRCCLVEASYKAGPMPTVKIANLLPRLFRRLALHHWHVMTGTFWQKLF